MLPPSDSLAHQNLKLAEVLASIQKQTAAAAAAPPPPYAATASTATPVHSNITTPELLGGFEDDEEDDSLSLAPIVIKIDTSISIDGQNNTVTILSASEDSHPDAQNPVSSIQQLQLQQQRRQAKSAQLASAIISALKSAGALDDRETGRQRPIEVDVNAGIRIRGNSNMICPGARRRSASDLVSGQPDRKRRAQSVCFYPYYYPILGDIH
ncbi:hypothetical protein A7D00_5124 [Trichophyton violaceum]|uniref:Uncharacterized protein n=1 Tax=Trichophyton violaceum TaxID=34388 RepID=A0A178FFI9_TRIVO|nr:hypothetical protein A7D00_5124 [Trichophyton violaceum]